MRKKYSLISLCIILVFALWGCGNVKKEKKEYNNQPVFSTEWIMDELGWIAEEGPKLTEALENFYAKTGIKAMVYLYAYDGTERWRTIEMAKEKAEELYKKIFGEDESHFLLVFFASEYDEPVRMEGCISYVVGKGIEDIMDFAAKDKFEKAYWKYYDNMSLSVEEIFANTFEETRKALDNE